MKYIGNNEECLEWRFSELTTRLWNVKMFNEPGLCLAQQLSVQPALIVMLRGEASLESEDGLIQLHEGTAYFCPGGKTFGLSGRSQSQALAFIFHFSIYRAVCGSRRQLEETDGEQLVMGNEVWTFSSPDRLNLLCRSVYECFYHTGEIKRWRAQLDFQELLYEFFSELGERRTGSRKQGLELAKSYIDEHFFEDLTMEHLAGIAELSPNYFADVFKKTYGRSVMDYLTQTRMDKAKKLMLGSDCLLREVAHSVGYKDEFYFSRKFKKEFGFSPTAYIKKRKNKVALYGSTSLLGFVLPLEIIPYAAPLHPKWSNHYYHKFGPEIPVHLDAYRQNHYKTANLDKLEAAGPEIIICTDELESWEKERLRNMAPIHELQGANGDWRSQLSGLADLLDRKPEAAQWMESFRTKMIALHRKVTPTSKRSPKILSARFYHDQLVINDNRGGREVLFDHLGCRLPDLPHVMVDHMPLTWEMLRETDADHVLLLVRQDSETLEHWARLQSAPEWISLRHVREGRVHLLPSYPWREYSPFALEQMAESAVTFLSGNCP
ncbi:AraC family transcriptional regulator [Paenibacillus sp. DMB20]|uniref:AraC family transcriptional regulator n=1 Tax=Paenibacillus sp. DMB20 TaxID=1642570 RepID=UPI000627AFE9|nr:AraC family transcriptional regulator [Paenibacillus sp. DMB20]KKO51091.1 AraC family transcriptional regulator [Paenibacillus sp. DMB20]